MQPARKPPGTGALPELLAPAGSPEALRAAIAAGADAVYLSGKKFGARKFAANFSEDEIREGIRLAHRRGVRVYVTVNTLVHDRELPGVADYLVRLYAAGVDAVLVQDAGVAAVARVIVPGLTLHASTQMTVHNADGVLQAAADGFSRVVLSRELSLPQIRKISEQTRHTGTGLEVFAHGALCYSYSGQCLLSSVIGGRSGNRGMCAQPCRKPYTLVAGDRDAYGRPGHLQDLPAPGMYLLSPKDLCTYRILPELAGSPVVSLKIEGRMKSPEYVAVVVSTYRRALEAIAAGNWKPSPDAERDLLLAFNRGFTKGYLAGDRHAALMARDAPDNRGIRIGTVKSQDRATGAIAVRLDGTLIPAPGDGLLFADPACGREDWGFALNNAPVATAAKTVTFLVPRPVAPDSVVSLTSSRELEARARQILARPPADLVHRVPVDLSIAIDGAGSVIMQGRLESATGKMVTVSFRPDIILVPARSRPLSRGELEAQLRKTGDTPFVIREIDLAYDGTRFAPVSELNRMRREFLAQAEEALLASSIPPGEAVAMAYRRLADFFPEHPDAPLPDGDAGTDPLLLTIYADTEEIAAGALREGCTSIVFEPTLALPRHTCRAGRSDGTFREQASGVIVRCREAGATCILKLPKITGDDYLAAVISEIAFLREEGLAGCMVENAGAGHAIRTRLPGLVLHGAAGLNLFNHRAACHYAQSCRSLTLSPELSRQEIAELVRAARAHGCSASFALVVQGIGEAMITEDCLSEPLRHCRADNADGRSREFLGIRDETGRIFPVMSDGECRTRIGNAVETCLVDHLPAIRQAGISEVVIDARGRTGAYAAAMTRIYREAIGRMGAGTGTMDLPGCKERVKGLAYGGITAGHFLRGLKE